MEEQIQRIEHYVCILSSNIQIDEVFDFNVREMVDRVLNYTNRQELPTELERIIARAIISIYKKIKDEEINNGEEQRQVSSISDNGQSVSYSDKVKTYMINSNDDDLFYGFLSQINKFVKAKVVGDDEYSKQLQERNV